VEQAIDVVKLINCYLFFGMGWGGCVVLHYLAFRAVLEVKLISVVCQLLLSNSSEIRMVILSKNYF